VAFSGVAVISGTIDALLGRHTGGAPGTDTLIDQTNGPTYPYAGLTCSSGATPVDALAADGGVAGETVSQNGTGGIVSQATFWNANNAATTLPLAAGDGSEEGVAVATGRRMVVQGTNAAGGQQLFFWHNGTRTKLSLPAGWTLSTAVELTDHGLFVADLHNSAGTLRPAVWDMSGL
jgi:hypothetical protein